MYFTDDYKDATKHPLYELLWTLNRPFIDGVCVNLGLVTATMYRLYLCTPSSVPVWSYLVIKASLKIAKYRCECRSLGYLIVLSGQSKINKHHFIASASVAYLSMCK